MQQGPAREGQTRTVTAHKEPYVARAGSVLWLGAVTYTCT